MTGTIADIEDAYLIGKTLFDQWLEEYEKQFMGPLAQTMVAALANIVEGHIDNLPPEVQAQLDQLMQMEAR